MQNTDSILPHSYANMSESLRRQIRWPTEDHEHSVIAGEDTTYPFLRSHSWLSDRYLGPRRRNRARICIVATCRLMNGRICPTGATPTYQVQHVKIHQVCMSSHLCQRGVITDMIRHTFQNRRGKRYLALGAVEDAAAAFGRT